MESENLKTFIVQSFYGLIANKIPLGRSFEKDLCIFYCLISLAELRIKYWFQNIDLLATSGGGFFYKRVQRAVQNVPQITIQKMADQKIQFEPFVFYLYSWLLYV